MKLDAKKIAGIGLFTALVVVLQFLVGTIKLGLFSITLTLAPIIIGAALYGIIAGAWLGFAFGMTVILSGDCALFLPINPVGTVVVVLLKGILAGLAAALIYKALEKKSGLGAVICAGITAPVVNTGIFVLGCYLFFMPLINEWATAAGAPNAGLFVITGVVGFNFVVELAINHLRSYVIVRLIDVLQKRMR